MQFGTKQATVALGIAEGHWPLALLVGATRSGKTECALAGYMHRVSRRHNDYDAVWVARSRAQMLGVVASKAKHWAQRNGLSFTMRQHFAEVGNAHGGVNRFWFAIAAESDKEGERIQGQGFCASYADEVTRIDPDYLLMVRSRTIEVPGAINVMTCNPGGPDHPIKLDYADKLDRKELPGIHVRFAMSDNPILGPSQIEEIKAQYAPGSSFYRRMILGEWSAEEGLVHPNVTWLPAPPDGEVRRWEVWLDYADSSVTHALLVGYSGSKAYVVDEWRWDGRTQGPLAPSEQASRIWAWATGHGTGRSVAVFGVPSDASGLGEALGKLAGPQSIMTPPEHVVWGTQATNTLLSSGDVVVSPNCRHLAREMSSLRWAARAEALGEDRPDKTTAGGAHGCDALRYACSAIRWQMGYRPS